ncbi:DUF3168 domain-containing protein [Oceanobacillus profundus]|uniref:tail completion protein gp17 n=1 Tax=Oceanobacillus profundus TaxID=372463 RepID=UPI00203A4673|nr:DUF3168 domain-containing protein [Oceanobacillus profundus]MCM3396785.1 DUF3168 domain-containing protein [Oceanobacillus profundus]
MSDLGNYDAQSELFQALRTDEELASLAIGGFHNLVAEQDSPFPRVVYSEINNVPSGHADNEESRATVNFQVSIFTDSQTVMHEKAMTKAIDRIMKSLEYGKYDSENLFETDTGLYHKPLRYEKNFYGGNE